MDNIEKPVFGRKVDASLPSLFIRAGIFVTGKLVEKDLPGIFEANSMPQGLIAVPDKGLPVQRREHVHMAIVYIVFHARHPQSGLLRVCDGAGDGVVELDVVAVEEIAEGVVEIDLGLLPVAAGGDLG